MRPQVVRSSVRDFEIDKRADRQRTRHEDQSVDLRRVPPRASDRNRLAVAGFVFGFTDSFDKDLHRCAYERPVLAQRDCLLRLHDRIATLLGDVSRYCSQIKGDRPGTRFRRVGEDADVIELLLLHKIEQRLELLVCFTWVADDERGAHHGVRHPGAGMIDQAAGHGDVARPVHSAQHGWMRMLDRHVEVGQERVVLGHDVDHAQCQRAGVDVEHAQPRKIGHAFHDLLKQAG
jgi:hypothetical protein